MVGCLRRGAGRMILFPDDKTRRVHLHQENQSRWETGKFCHWLTAVPLSDVIFPDFCANSGGWRAAVREVPVSRRIAEAGTG